MNNFLVQVIIPAINIDVFSIAIFDFVVDPPEMTFEAGIVSIRIKSMHHDV